MTDFDRRFADRVRDVFDDYEEPVDEAALARLQASLRTPAPVPAPVPVAPDRPPLAPRRRARLWRAVGLAVFGALALALGVSLWPSGQAPEPSPEVAAVDPAESAPLAESAPPEASGETTPPGGAADLVPEAGPLAVPSSEPRTGSPAPAPLAVRRPSPAAHPVGTPSPEAAGPVAAASEVATSEASGEESRGAEPAAVAEASPGASPEAVPAVAPEAAAAPDPGPPLAEASPIVIPEASPRAESVPVAPAPEASGAGLRLTVASSAGVANGEVAGGAAVAAGLSREFAVGRGLSVSAGGALAYARYAFGPGALSVAEAFDVIENDPTANVSVTDRSEVETLALEVPVDLRVGVARLGRGRLDVGVGLTSAVYVAQTFSDEGQRIRGEVIEDPTTPGDITIVDAEAFRESESVDALGRIDLARQLNLSVGYDARPLAVEAFARLPLRGVTSREIPLTTLGVRLRAALR